MTIQANSALQANALLALQPWVATHYTLTPTRLRNELTASESFHTAIEQVGETPDGLFWFVSHGSRAGIYLNTYVFSTYSVWFFSAVLI
jgi:hypothetical protein